MSFDAASQAAWLLALTVRELPGGPSGGSGARLTDPEAQKKADAVAKRALTAAKNKDELRVFVERQSAAVLSSWIWQQAQEDRAWMSDLKLWAAQQKAQSDPAALGKAVTEVLRNRQGFLDYNDCRIYVRRAEKALPLLKQALSVDAVQARQLCESALKKLYKVGEHADDSNGEIGWMLEQIQEIHLEAIRAAPPDAAWVETWFALMDADPFGNWDETLVLEAAGDAVVQQYGKKVMRDWDNYLAQSMPNQNPSVASRDRRLPYRSESFDRVFYSVRKRYLAYLKQQGDIPAMIEAMLKVAKSSWDYHEAIEICEAHGKHREALDYALKAQKLYGRDSHIEDDLLRCYARDGWDDEALVIHRNRLEAQPSRVHFYVAALNAAVRAGRDRAAYRLELYTWLEQYELTKENGYGNYRTTTGKTRNVSTRASWLLFEQEPLAALAVALGDSHYCDSSILYTLATKLPQSHNAEAVKLYKIIFNDMMHRASSPYKEEIELVKEVIPRMPPLEASCWVQALRETHKTKRNFTQGLPTTFAVPN